MHLNVSLEQNKTKKKNHLRKKDSLAQVLRQPLKTKKKKKNLLMKTRTLILLFCWSLVVIFSLSVWGLIVTPKHNQDCSQDWQETNGTVLSLSSNNYSFQCVINGFNYETINEKYQVQFGAIQKDSSLRLFNYCSSIEQYWCCINNTVTDECSLTTIYHGNTYEYCFSFVSVGTKYSTLNVSVNQQILAYYDDSGWADVSPYAFSDSPATDCFSSMSKKFYMCMIGVAVSCLSLIYLTWFIYLERKKLFPNYFSRYPNTEPLIQ